MTNFHRLFGLCIEDFCIGSCLESETEKDVARQRQLLDVVIIKRNAERPLPSPLPDGLDNLADHNLLSYKSLHEPLDSWALRELTGHYVNYRKILAEPKRKKLLPEARFRLYALATRYPQKLAKSVTLTPVSEGVYEVQCFDSTIRILVLSKMPATEANAIWAMFSANPEKITHGEALYQWRNPEIGRLVVRDLNEQYRKEHIMAYTHEDYLREQKQKWLKTLTPEELLQSVAPETLLQALPSEVVKALPPEVVKAWLARQEPDTKQ